LDALRYIGSSLGAIRVDEESLRAITDPSRVADFVAQLTLVHALSNKTPIFWNFPSWSISAEIMAYLSFGLIWAVFYGFLREVAVVAIMLAATFVTVGLIKLDFGGAFGHGMFRAISGFFVGYWAQRIWRIVPKRRLPAISVIEISALTLVFVLVHQGDHHVVHAIAPFVFGAVVLLFSIGGGVVSKVLRSKPLQALGAWSYGIYMTHVFILALLGIAVRIAQRFGGTQLYSESRSSHYPNDSLVDLGNPLLMDALTLINICVVVIVARYVHIYLEMPGQKYVLKRFGSSRAE
jgi:peptidoglycan/LPS O-acetylase OafA/YrhL